MSTHTVPEASIAPRGLLVSVVFTLPSVMNGVRPPHDAGMAMVPALSNLTPPQSDTFAHERVRAQLLVKAFPLLMVRPLVLSADPGPMATGPAPARTRLTGVTASPG